jgi:hypothetical protein
MHMHMHWPKQTLFLIKNKHFFYKVYILLVKDLDQISWSITRTSPKGS